MSDPAAEVVLPDLVPEELLPPPCVVPTHADLGAFVLLALDLEEPPPFFDQASSLASCTTNTAEQIKMGFRNVTPPLMFG
jgi:hypothetical protein